MSNSTKRTMTRLMILLTTVVAVIAVLPATKELPEMLEPGLLALHLNEDEFEDYLDKWIEMEQLKNQYVLSMTATRIGGCQIRVHGDLGLPQPVYLYNDNYIVPTKNTGIINLNTGDPVTIACTGSGTKIQHPQITVTASIETAVCWNGNLVYGSGWLSGNGAFGNLTCSGYPVHNAEYTSERCYNNNLVIRVGYSVQEKFYPLYWSCFDSNRLEVLYSWYELNPQNEVNEVNVPRPGWQDGGFFGDVNIDTLYTQAHQKTTIAGYVGEKLAEKYVYSTYYLARGHLAAKTDMIFATGQRATFYYINAAPQWQSINAGNWNRLEQNLRKRIGNAGYHTTVWTGTWGVSQLRKENGELVDIYLDNDVNNNPLVPVPLYYYKVVYDQDLELGTAFVTINNPHYFESEVRELQFCTDYCRNNTDFSWLKWQPDRIDVGYSFCCTVDDFRSVVPHLPSFSVNGLLT